MKVTVGFVLSIVSLPSSVIALVLAVMQRVASAERLVLVVICVVFVATSGVGCLWTMSGHPTWIQGYSGRERPLPAASEPNSQTLNGRAIVASEFVFESASFASAHASTIVETRDGLVTAWFGGTREGAADVGVWLSRHTGGTWTTPVEIANGAQADGTRFACWNPVLFDTRDRGLLLFYKVGPSPQTWWGMVRTSPDNGRTWTDARRLPDGILGPIKNKPVRLGDGTVVAGSSTESPERPSKWRVHFERSTDGGLTWTATPPLQSADERAIDAIQPSLLIHPGDRLQAVGRTRSQRIFETWSTDGGRTWTPISLTSLPNPNSGIDAVTLRDGRHLIVYNHTTEGRTSRTTRTATSSALATAAHADSSRTNAPVFTAGTPLRPVV